jgi:hypothetical protein
MPNPKTIAYQEMMTSFEKLEVTISSARCRKDEQKIRLLRNVLPTAFDLMIPDIKKWLTSSYLHDLEEEVKRLGNTKKIPKLEGIEYNVLDADPACVHGWNSALDSEIALCESAIKEIKALLTSPTNS